MGVLRVFCSRALLVLPLALFAAGCADPIEFPTPPALPDPITEVFSGNITVNGAATHPFASTGTGTVTATLVTLSPESTTTVGLSLGTWNGAACNIIIANDAAVRTTVVTGTVTTIGGQLCVRVYDVGQMTEATSYEVSVFHP